MVIAIAGNKCDLPEDNRRVTEQMGLNFAKRINAIFQETSALENVNID